MNKPRIFLGSSSQQAKLLYEHKASVILDRICSRVAALSNQYRDHLARQNEVNVISQESKIDDLKSFQLRLKEMKEHHAKYPQLMTGGFEVELALLVGDEEEELAKYDHCHSIPMPELAR